MTTQSTKASPGVSRLGPNLNDLELGNCLAVLLYQARQVNELTANRKGPALGPEGPYALRSGQEGRYSPLHDLSRSEASN